jgi:hypothetical protein
VRIIAHSWVVHKVGFADHAGKPRKGLKGHAVLDRVSLPAAQLKQRLPRSWLSWQSPALQHHLPILA